MDQLAEWVDPGRPDRLHLRSRRGRARPDLQDVGRLQPRVQRAGVLLARGSATTASRTTAGRCGSASSSPCSSSSPLVGLLLDRALFRYMRTASWQVKLVSALGLLVAIPEIVKAIYSPVPAVFPPSVAPLIGIDRFEVFEIFGYSIGANALDDRDRHRDRGRGPRGHLPLHADRAADARGRGEPAHGRARRCRRRPRRAWSPGCCRARSPGSPGSCSRRRTPRSTAPSTSS